jgi:anaerobic ribonucleoside-triphosphate reductase activating protein
MRIAGIVRDSIVNGVGIRDVIFTQGCPHHCEGCHNSQTWDFNDGAEVTLTYLLEELSNSSNNVTISGGEPLSQFSELIPLIKLIHRKQNKTVWLYTGHKYEHLSEFFWKHLAEIGVEVVVDGKYEKDKKDTTLLFRGSSNQRLIDLPKSIKENRVVLWEEIT